MSTWTALREPSPSTSGRAETDDDEGNASSASQTGLTRKQKRTGAMNINTNAEAGPSNSRRREEDGADPTGGLVAAINASGGKNNANTGSASASPTVPSSSSGFGRLSQREPRADVRTVRVKRTREEKARVRGGSPDSIEREEVPAKRQKIGPSGSVKGKKEGKKPATKKKMQIQSDDPELPKRPKPGKLNAGSKGKPTAMGPPASATVGSKARSRIPSASTASSSASAPPKSAAPRNATASAASETSSPRTPSGPARFFSGTGDAQDPFMLSDSDDDVDPPNTSTAKSPGANSPANHSVATTSAADPPVAQSPAAIPSAVNSPATKPKPTRVPVTTTPRTAKGSTTKSPAISSKPREIIEIPDSDDEPPPSKDMQSHAPAAGTSKLVAERKSSSSVEATSPAPVQTKALPQSRHGSPVLANPAPQTSKPAATIQDDLKDDPFQDLSVSNDEMLVDSPPGLNDRQSPSGPVEDDIGPSLSRRPPSAPASPEATTSAGGQRASEDDEDIAMADIELELHFPSPEQLPQHSEFDERGPPTSPDESPFLGGQNLDRFKDASPVPANTPPQKNTTGSVTLPGMSNDEHTPPQKNATGSDTLPGLSNDEHTPPQKNATGSDTLPGLSNDELPDDKPTEPPVGERQASLPEDSPSISSNSLQERAQPVKSPFTHRPFLSTPLQLPRTPFRLKQSNAPLASTSGTKPSNLSQSGSLATELKPAASPGNKRTPPASSMSLPLIGKPVVSESPITPSVTSSALGQSSGGHAPSTHMKARSSSGSSSGQDVAVSPFYDLSKKAAARKKAIGLGSSSTKPRERSDSSSSVSQLSRKSASPLSRSTSADNMRMAQPTPRGSTTGSKPSQKISVSQPKQQSPSTQKSSQQPPWSSSSNPDKILSPGPSVHRTLVEPTRSFPSVATIRHLMQPKCATAQAPLASSTGQTTRSDAFTKAQSPVSKESPAVSTPDEPPLPSSPTAIQSAPQPVQRPTTPVKPISLTGSWRDSPSAHKSPGRKLLANTIGSSPAAHHSGEPYVPATPPSTSPPPDDRIADTAEMAEAVEAVSSQIDQGLSLDVGGISPASHDAMDVDEAVTDNDRDPATATSTEPLATNLPQTPQNVDEEEDVLEYVDDPNPRIYIPDVPVGPAPVLAPKAPEPGQAESESEPASDPFSSPPPVQHSRRLRRGPRKNYLLPTEDLEDESEAEAKEASILKRRSSPSASAASDVPYYTEHSVTPEEEEPPEPPRRPSATSQILTFQDFRQQLKIHIRQRKDIPSVFQDHINNLPKSYQKRPQTRYVFEGMMAENTCRDEPGAPRISVINNVDSQATPPWEFHYSNHMWYGNDVPLPDPQKLKGCDCIGRCNPKSTTCACAKRQKLLHEDPKFRGFAYDKDGHLVFGGDDLYPIFECNEMCRCDDDCMNRVIRRGRKCQVDLVKTLNKGWGVFAADNGQKITKGTYIGTYAGELIPDAEGEERGKSYNNFGRTYLFNLDNYHLKFINADGELMSKKEREAVEARYEVEPEHDDFDNKYVVDAYHAGNFTRFLNHSCAPNCALFSAYLDTPDLTTPLLTLFSIRDIEPREELSFDYNGDKAPGPADATKKGDAVHARCYCGAPNCRRIMF